MCIRDSYRTICTTSVLLSIDEEKGPQVFKIDPAGHCQGFKGCTAGAKEQEAMTLLEKAFKKKAQAGGNFSTDEATEAVIETLQNVIGSDFKPGDLEVSVATTTNPVFKLLNPTEVEQYLNKIADKSQLTLTLQYHSLTCLLYTSPSPRDLSTSRMPSSA
eukprot:TRINITY_DN1393_c0_g3_i2.p2 TRINITY_DN1393_c0_g3~~TRINITY_DN1393_c0_g3_i2.p2  ORF type:complete len:160 (+),score=66.97 TRINITY_DN1393_c0_g3_i2:73-552(+)